MEYDEFSKNVVVSFASSGDNEIISAPTNGRIVIDTLAIVPNSAVSLKLIAGSRDQSGVYSLTANQGFTLDNPSGSRWGVVRCLPGEAFKINLGSAVQVSGLCDYRIINE